MKFLIFKFLFVGLHLFHFACATMPAEQCQTVDWKTVGFKDGASGEFVNYFSEHERSCQNHMNPNSKLAYRDGWNEGHAQYCTPENGYRAGLDGGRFTGVCPEKKYPEFFEQFKLGHRVSELKAQKTKLQNQMESSDTSNSTLVNIAKAYHVLNGSNPHQDTINKIESIDEKISAIDNNAPGGPQLTHSSEMNSIADLKNLSVDRGQVHLLGSLVGTVIGFGVGHAIQGRYSESGWKWTLGEFATIGSLAVATNRACGDRVETVARDIDGTLSRQTECSDNGPNPEFVSITLIAWLGFRVWQSYDLFSYPNPKYTQSIYVLPNGISWAVIF